MSLEGNDAPEDPQDVENFIRTLLTTLDVFKSDSIAEIVAADDDGTGEKVQPEAQPQPVGAGEWTDIKEIYTSENVDVKAVKSVQVPTKSSVAKKLSIDSRKLLFAPTDKETVSKARLDGIQEGEFKQASDDKVVVTQFIRDMIEKIEYEQSEKSQPGAPREQSKADIAGAPRRRSKADVKSEKEERESTHRFIRGLLENIDVYKAVMRKRMKERQLLEPGYGEGFTGFYEDYAEYLAERSEEEEEAVEVLPKEVFRQESLRSTCYKCVCMPNGDIYEGEYIQGKRHGRGLYCFKNGARYDGFWKKGLKHGKGQFLYPDGSRYIGNWKRDLKHGQGVYYYINGDIYDGGWYKGVRHGLGTYTYKSSNVTHYGTWKYGRMDGPGVLNYPYYKYHGNFERNLPKGPGCFVFDGKYMQHGFYVHERDPTVLPQADLQMEYAQTEGMGGPYEQYQDSVGLVPVWKARQLTKYCTDLLPPEPVPLLVKESQESMVDIIEYLQQQYAGGRPTLGRQGIGRPCW